MIKVLAVSGYKPFELGIFKNDHPSVMFIKAALKKELIPMIEDGLEWVLISGQLGVELWAAEVIFELKSEYPEVKLAVITPFLDQRHPGVRTTQNGINLSLHRQISLIR